MNPLSPLNRAQEVITLVCWIISHELTPLTPEEDPLQHALPIRPDIDRLDDALSPLFLIEPHLHQLNKHIAAINQSSGTPSYPGSSRSNGIWSTSITDADTLP